jgi:hypothetical protein
LLGKELVSFVSRELRELGCEIVNDDKENKEKVFCAFSCVAVEGKSGVTMTVAVGCGEVILGHWLHADANRAEIKGIIAGWVAQFDTTWLSMLRKK